MPDSRSNYDQARLVRLQAKIDANPEAFLSTTDNLRTQDLALIGKLIQLYCYSDLNARRVIDAVRHATLPSAKRNASGVPEADVFPELRKAAGLLPDGNLMREGLIHAAATIEMHRVHRHNFAHWAARKVAKEEVLILFSKNAPEVARRKETPPGPDELKYALVPIEPWSVELDKLAAHTNYLARVAPDLEKNRDLWAARFAEEKERRRQEAIAAEKKAGAGKRARATKTTT